MDILKRMNAAVAYIEAHLLGGLDMDELARITLYTPDGFNRFFSYAAGMTLKEYVRRRRLTLAAYDLRASGEKVIDVALKYGYESADSFARAFSHQHRISPSAARRPCAPLLVYPPISFHILIKGAREMNLKIVETERIRLKGLSKPFSGPAVDRFEQEHVMWADECDDYPHRICSRVPGVWYGIWDGGRYSIAKIENEAGFEGLETIEIPGGTHAIFTTGLGGFADDELPRLRDQIFSSWLPDSGYEQAYDYEVEVYYLFSKDEKYKRYYEIWIPLRKKNGDAGAS